MAPAALTKDLEMYRIIQILPLLLLLTYAGFHLLISSLPREFKAMALVVLIGSSVSLDSYNLFIACAEGAVSENAWKFKSKESFDSYPVLSQTAAQLGPGFIPTELMAEPNDQSLYVATYSFNTALNQKLSDANPKWVGLISDSFFRGYLTNKFPRAEWKPIPDTLNDSTTPQLGLLIIPVNGKINKIMEKWSSINFNFRKTTYQMLNHVAGYPLQSVLDFFFKGYALVRHDPYLEYCFWQRIMKYELKADDSDALFLVNQPIPTKFHMEKFNYELGLMYYRFAIYLTKRAEFSAALRSLKNASYFDPEFTPTPLSSSI